MPIASRSGSRKREGGEARVPDYFDLDSPLPYLHDAGLQIGNAIKAELKPFDLSLTQWRVLAAVAAGEGQTITGVAQRAGTEIYTTSRLLAAATRNGLVSRRPGADARAVVVSLTRSGRRLVSRITPQARLLERRALAGLPAEDSERLLALLKRIVGNLSGGNRSGGRLSGPARAAAGPSTKAVLR